MQDRNRCCSKTVEELVTGLRVEEKWSDKVGATTWTIVSSLPNLIRRQIIRKPHTPYVSLAMRHISSFIRTPHLLLVTTHIRIALLPLSPSTTLQDYCFMVHRVLRNFRYFTVCVIPLSDLLYPKV